MPKALLTSAGLLFTLLLVANLAAQEKKEQFGQRVILQRSNVSVGETEQKRDQELRGKHLVIKYALDSSDKWKEVRETYGLHLVPKGPRDYLDDYRIEIVDIPDVDADLILRLRSDPRIELAVLDEALLPEINVGDANTCDSSGAILGDQNLLGAISRVDGSSYDFIHSQIIQGVPQPGCLFLLVVSDSGIAKLSDVLKAAAFAESRLGRTLIISDGNTSETITAFIGGSRLVYKQEEREALLQQIFRSKDRGYPEHVQKELERFPSSPLNYFSDSIREKNGKTFQYSSAEAIASVTTRLNDSIDHRVLLTFLELRWQLLSGGAYSPEMISSDLSADALGSAVASKVAGWETKDRFTVSLVQFVEVLISAQQGIYYKSMYHYPDGTTVDLGLAQMGGWSAALDTGLAVLARSKDEWELWRGNSESGFITLYLRLFGQSLSPPPSALKSSLPYFGFLERHPFQGDVFVNSFFDHDASGNDGDINRLDGETLEDADQGISWYDGHKGIDYRTHTNPIYAAHDGIVASVADLNDCQSLTRIDIDYAQSDPTFGTLTSRYLHLDHRLNDSGEKYWTVGTFISAGELIGHSGNNGSPGCSTAPHLHLVVVNNATNLLDPFGYADDGGHRESSHWISSDFVDDKSVGFENFNRTSVPWQEHFGSAIGGRYLSTETVYNPTRHWDNWAYWTATLENPGNYRVRAYIPETGRQNELTSKAKYTIFHNGSSTNVEVNQAGSEGGWITLGFFDFVAGNQASVRLVDEVDDADEAGKRILVDALKWDYVGPQSVQASPDLTVLNDSTLKMAKIWSADVLGVSFNFYKISLSVRNVGTAAAAGSELCVRPLFGPSSCQRQMLPAIPPGETRAVTAYLYSSFDFDTGPSFGPIVNLEIVPSTVSPRELPEFQNNNSTSIVAGVHYQSTSQCSGSLGILDQARGKVEGLCQNLRFAMIEGLRIEPISQQLEFIMRSEVASPGDPVIDVEALRKDFRKLFLQALAVPNHKHRISLNLLPDLTGEAEVPAPFERTDIATIYLDADVAMKFDMFGESDLHNETTIWTHLIEASPYWPELVSSGFIDSNDVYPLWVTRAFVQPGEVSARETNYSIIIEDVGLDLQAGIWTVEPYLNLQPYGLSAGAVADLTQRLATYRNQLKNILLDYAQNVVEPDMNSSTTSEPKYRRLKAIFSTIALAQWYKTKAVPGSSLPFAGLIDSENLQGISAPPFNWNYWNAQAAQVLWEGPCELVWGQGSCQIIGGLSMENSAPQVLGPLSSVDEDTFEAILDNLSIVQEGANILDFGGIIASDRADLSIGEISINEPSLVNTVSQISFEIQNSGLSASNSFLVRTESEQDGVTTILQEDVVSLQAGQATSLNVGWVPADTGTATVHITADALNSVSEQNETNNAASRTIEIFSPFPKVEIFSPRDGEIVGQFESGAILLSGAAWDASEGTLSGSALVWDSNVDGVLGEGAVLDTVNLSVGTHLITLVATASSGESASESVSISVNGQPEIVVTSPALESATTWTSFEVTWSDQDVDDNAVISLYYDSDGSGLDGFLIVDGLFEDADGATDSYEWDVTGIPEGAYYLYAIIDDGRNSPNSSYSEGVITIRRSRISQLGSISNLDQGLPMNGPQDVKVAGDRALVASWISNSLAIINIADSAAPEYIASVSDGVGGAVLSAAYSIDIEPGLAYIAARNANAVEILSIENIDSPSHLSTVEDGEDGAMLGQPRAVFAARNYLYVTSMGANALEIIDVMDPASPIHVGSITHGTNGAMLEEPYAVYVSNSIAYVASYSSDALEIIDVSDPTEPQHVSAMPVEAPTAVAVSGDYAYVGSQASDRVMVVDISSPATPAIIGAIGLENLASLDEPFDLVVREGYLYVVSLGSDALSIIDVSDPWNPTEVDSIARGVTADQLLNPTSVAISNGLAVVTSEGSDSLGLFDISYYYKNSPEIALSPYRYKFGELAVGSFDMKNFLVGNLGDGGLTIDSVGLSGASSFSIYLDSCSETTLAPNESCSIAIEFSPSSVGEDRGSLKIHNNDSDEGVSLIEFSGQGVGPQLLSVTKTGEGGGLVSSDPAGITCGSFCGHEFTYGTVVSLSATMAPGSTFLGWTGGNCSNTGTCVLQMDQDHSVTAAFGLADFPLTVNLAGTGSGTVTSNPVGINCGTSCSHLFAFGTMVTLTPVASVTSVFTGWSGGSCTGTASCVLQTDQATTVTASFDLREYPLNVTLTGNGTGTVVSTPTGIACGADCSEVYVHGTMVALEANAGSHSEFQEWSGAGCSGTGLCTITMDAAKSVAAIFTLLGYELVVTKDGSGDGRVTSVPAGIDCGADCSESYPALTSVTLTAAADTGSEFTGWSGEACSGTTSCVVTIEAANTVTATFGLVEHSLTVTKTGSGAGTITSNPAGINCDPDCTADFVHGTVVMLNASPETGSSFDGWNGAGCSGTDSCEITLEGAETVTASFTLEEYTVTVIKDGDGEGIVSSDPSGIDCGETCSTDLPHGTEVTLEPFAQVGSAFAGWSSSSCTGTTACIFTVVEPTILTATFVTQCIDAFESDIMNWIALPGPGDGGGTDRWELVTSDSHSPIHSWFGSGEDQIKDQLFQTAFRVPVTEGTRLRFFHHFDTEAGFDGGVLEVSINGGVSWFDILSGNGGTMPPNPSRFIENGYNTTISNCCSNPLANRAAWSGGNSGWEAVVVDLTDFAGHELILRWRIGTDTANAGNGWWVDDIALGVPTCPFGTLFEDGFESGNTSNWSNSVP